MKATERIALGKNQGSLFKRAGSNNWYLYLCVRGKDVIESTGTADEKEARKIHAQRIKERGADDLGLQPFTGPALKRLRVREFLAALESYFEREQKKCWPKARSHMVPLYQHFGDWRVLALSEQSIEAYVAKRRALGRTDSTINRELQILGQALRLTVQNVRVPFVPTMRRLPGEKDNAREGFFEAADFHAVVAALPEHLQDVARFGYITGWRKGEIVGLRWSAVNRTSGIITLPRRSAKNNKSRTMPVAADLMPLIERRWAARVITRGDGTTTMADHVFHHAGQPIGDFRKAWRTACKTAGVSGRLFHDLRRTAVRDMVLHSGVPEVVAMSISGHRTRSVFDRYTISAEDNKRAALTARHAYAAGAAEGPPTRTVAVLPAPAKRVKKAAQRA